MRNPKLLALAVFLLFIIGAGVFWRNSYSISNEQVNSTQDIDKEYKVGEEKITVLGIQDKKEIDSIDLSAKEGNFIIKFNPHQVILIPDKKQVWISATAPEKQFQSISKESLEHIHLLMTSDQIIIVSTETNNIVKRLNMGMQLELTDLIVTPDAKYAYVSAETGNAIYKINTSTYKADLIQLPPESKPHQLALSTDGTKLFARNQVNNNLFLISTKTKEVKNQENTGETKNLKWSNH